MPRSPPKPEAEAKPETDWLRVISTLGGLIGTGAAVVTVLWRIGIIPSASPTPTAMPPTPVYTAAPSGVPSPAVTHTTVPTAHPTPTPARPRVLLEDDFSDPQSGWEADAKSEFELGYVEGEYRIAVQSAELVVWGNPSAKQRWGDVMVLVDARKVAGPDNNGYGIIVRELDRANFYVFQVGSDGTYSVQKSVDDDWFDLVAWTPSAAVNQGNALNLLRVECQGTLLRFAVNDEELAVVEDDAFASGRVGLAVSTFEEGGVVVHFDNVLVRASQD